MNNELKAKIPFGNYRLSYDKMTVSHLNIQVIVKDKQHNLSEEEGDIVNKLIANHSINDIFGKEFKINILRKDGSVFFENEGKNIFFDPSLFAIEFYAEGNLVDINELYSHLDYKNANEEITALYFSKDKRGRYLSNNSEIPKIILNYYLQDEEHFFKFQELLNVKTWDFYLSSNKEERDEFINYVKTKNENIALYIEENLKEKPQRKLKV